MTIQATIKKLINKKRRGVVKTMPKPKLPRREEPKHMHTWKTVGKTYAPPTNLNITTAQNIPPQVLERAMFGVTTILWECVCGETKREELLGSGDDLLESLIDKAEKIGPQFVDRRGKSFIISIWKPPVEKQDLIPLK